MSDCRVFHWHVRGVYGLRNVGLAREALIYANVIGPDLGPKISSLATLRWLLMLSWKKSCPEKTPPERGYTIDVKSSASRRTGVFASLCK